MKTSQRFLRRLFLMSNMDVLLREAKYHRDNDEEEKLPIITLWKKGEEIGEARVLNDDS